MLRHLYKIFVVLVLMSFFVVACEVSSVSISTHPPTPTTTPPHIEEQTAVDDCNYACKCPLPPPQEHNIYNNQDGILFIMDTSPSVGDYCKGEASVMGMRYDIPNYGIKIISSMYPDSVWPKIGVLNVHDGAAFDSTDANAIFQSPSFYAELNQSPVSPPDKLESGTFYLDMLNAVRKYKSDYNFEKLTVIFISDGTFKNEDLENQESIKTILKEISSENSQEDIEFFFIPIYCDASQTESDLAIWKEALEDNAIYEQTREQYVTSFTTHEILPTLFDKSVVFSSLLDDYSTEWIFSPNSGESTKYDILNSDFRLRISLLFLEGLAPHRIHVEGGTFDKYYNLNSSMNNPLKVVLRDEGKEIFDNLGTLSGKWFVERLDSINKGEYFAFYWAQNVSFPFHLVGSVYCYEEDELVIPFCLLTGYERELEEKKEYYSVGWEIYDNETASDPLLKGTFPLEDILDISNGESFFKIHLPLKDFEKPRILKVFLLIGEKRIPVRTEHNDFSNTKSVKIDFPIEVVDSKIWEGEKGDGIWNIDFRFENEDDVVSFFAVTTKNPDEIEHIQTTALATNNNDDDDEYEYDAYTPSYDGCNYHQQILPDRKEFEQEHDTINLSDPKYKNSGYKFIDISWNEEISPEYVFRCSIITGECQLLSVWIQANTTFCEE